MRRYEIRTLLAWIEAQVFEYDAIVITGDMNAHYLWGSGKPTIDVFTDDGFAVTRDTAPIKGDTGGTLAEGDRTYRPAWVFDYVLTRGSVSALSFTALDNKIDKSGAAYPSDHVPVVARITVN